MKRKYIIFIIVVISIAITILSILISKKENIKISNNGYKNSKILKLGADSSEESSSPVDEANEKNIFGLEICKTDLNFKLMEQLTDGVSDFISVSGNQIFRKIFLHDNETSWRDIAINATIQTGIIALSITLTSLGFGFATPLLNLFSPYQKNDNLPIDYDKIKLTVKDEFVREKIILCNTNIQNTISFMNNVYLSSKLTLNTNCDDNISNDYIFNCVKNNVDFNIVRPSYKVENKNKRVILKELLGIGSPPYDLFYNSNYGINFIKNYYKTNSTCAVQLLKAFITIMNLEIGYFQELSLIDTAYDPVNKDYINPWKSNYIGDIKRIGKSQISSSLIGRLQQYCKDLFEIIRNILKMYYNNLYWRMNCNQKDYYAGPNDKTWTDKSWGSCGGRTVKYFMQDRNKIIEEPQWIDDLEIKEKQVKIGLSDSVKFMKADENLKYIYINKFLFFLNDPFKQLKKLKKIAGIKWLENEKNYYDINPENNLSNYFYDAASEYYEINFKSDIEYEDNGGFPFGISSTSYKDAITNISQTIEQSFAIKTYPSSTVQFDMRNACSDLTAKIDASIFNGPFSDKKYTNNMTCEGDYYLSSLLPDKSPGSSTNNDFQNKSRITYCVDREDKTHPLVERINKCRIPDSFIFYDISQVVLQIAKSQSAENIFKNNEYILILTGYNLKEENIKISIKINKKDSSDYIIREDIESLSAKYYYNENKFDLNLLFKGNLLYDSVDGTLTGGKMDINADFNVKQNFMLDKTRNLFCARKKDETIPVGFPDSYPLNV